MANGKKGARETRLRILHDAVESEAAKLARAHGARLTCHRGCADCCVDGLTVFPVEADAIRADYAHLLEHQEPHPQGACAFLDGEGACRIYRRRPYVCRTQGLPLRWFEPGPEGGPQEFRDICPKNEEGPPWLRSTHPFVGCWAPMRRSFGRSKPKLTPNRPLESLSAACSDASVVVVGLQATPECIRTIL